MISRVACARKILAGFGPPMTDVQAARYVVQTHGVAPGEGEKPENFVLRIVQAFDRAKSPNWPADRARRWPTKYKV